MPDVLFNYFLPQKFAHYFAANNIGEGDVILGLGSSGPHSNGYSLVRKLVELSGLSYSAASPFSKSELARIATIGLSSFKSSDEILYNFATVKNVSFSVFTL